MSETIKSRPVYDPVEIDMAVQNHIFISEGGHHPSLQALFDQCEAQQKAYWVVSNSSDQTELPNGAESIDTEDFLQVLAGRFSQLPVSSCLYLGAEKESFLWDVHQVAMGAGLGHEQVKKLKPLTNERRLFCTHCYAVTEGVTHSPFECPGCQRQLLVRDHFSKLYGAYVGVQINAEDPADLPEKEEVA